LQTTLFFILIAFSKSAQGDKDSGKKNGRDFIAELSDLTIPVETAIEVIATRINSLLMPSAEQNNNMFWLNLLINTEEYQYEDDNKDLTQEVVLEKLNQFIDAAFPDVLTMNKQESKENLQSMYLKNLEAIYDEMERLMKREMITQFNNAGTVETITSNEITFHQSIPAAVSNKIIEKINLFISTLNIKPDVTVESIQQVVKERASEIQKGFAVDLKSLANLYLNALPSLQDEIKAILAASKEENDLSEEEMIEKIGFLFDIFGQASKGYKQNTLLIATFGEFGNEIRRSGRSSFFGSQKFKKIMGDLIQKYAQVIADYVSPKDSFSACRDFISSLIVPTNEPKIRDFFNLYSSKFLDTIVISEDDEDTFGSNILKTIDVVLYVDWTEGMSDWWVNSALPQFRFVMVPEEMLALNEMSKTAFGIRDLESEVPGADEFLFKLYDFLIYWAQQFDDVANETDWFLQASDYMDGLVLLEEPEGLLAEQKQFLLEYYYYAKLVVLSIRNEVSDNEKINFVKIVNDKENPEQYFLTFREWANEAIGHSNIMRTIKNWFIKYVKQNQPDRKVKAKNVKNGEHFLELSEVGEIELKTFYSLNVSIKNSRTTVKREDNVERKKVVFGVKKGIFAGKLNDLKKQKTSSMKDPESPKNKVVIEEKPVVIKKDTGVEDNSPKKVIVEENPNEETIEDKSPVKEITEESPKKDLLNEDDNEESPSKKTDKYIDVDEEIEESESSEHQEEVPDEETIETRENIIHSVTGTLSEEERDQIKKASNLVNSIQKIERVEDPETGDITEYIYIQVVPKDSDCYESLFE